MEGTVIALEEIPDETFASGILGKGVGIVPKEGCVYAPFDGKVSALFDTKHAIGLTSDDGMEMLIHVGINTVELNGKFYETQIADGDRIAAGQPLISFDIEGIRGAGYDITTAVLVSNADDYQEVTIEKLGAVKKQEKLMKVS